MLLLLLVLSSVLLPLPLSPSGAGDLDLEPAAVRVCEALVDCNRNPGTGMGTETASSVPIEPVLLRLADSANDDRLLRRSRRLATIALGKSFCRPVGALSMIQTEGTCCCCLRRGGIKRKKVCSGDEGDVAVSSVVC